MDFALRTAADIEQLSVARVCPNGCDYVAARAASCVKANSATRPRSSALPVRRGRWPTFMMEGGSAEKYTQRPELVSPRTENFFDAG